MPSLSELPGDIKRPRLMRALERLGFVINESGGNGSHYKATWPRTQKALTVKANLTKYDLKYLLKEIKEMTNGVITWEKIKENL